MPVLVRLAHAEHHRQQHARADHHRSKPDIVEGFPSRSPRRRKRWAGGASQALGRSRTRRGHSCCGPAQADAVHTAGKAGAVEPEYLRAAHSLTEQGWVSRRIQDDDVIFELTDEGLTALELNGLTERQSPN